MVSKEYPQWEPGKRDWRTRRWFHGRTSTFHVKALWWGPQMYHSSHRQTFHKQYQSHSISWELMCKPKCDLIVTTVPINKKENTTIPNSTPVPCQSICHLSSCTSSVMYVKHSESRWRFEVVLAGDSLSVCLASALNDVCPLCDD